MKKITLLFAMLIANLGFSQIILNGDFEEGGGNPPPKWTKVFGVNNFTAITGTVGAGTTYGGIWRANMGNDAMTIKQDLTSPLTNTTYEVNFYWKWNTATATTNAFVSIKDNDDPVTTNSVAAVTLPKATDSGIGNAWQQLTFTFSSASTNLSFQINKGVSGGINNALWFDEVTIAPSLSTQDLAKFNFRSYPNPTKENINISASKSINKIEIYNLLGQQVVKRELNSSSAQINVSNLSKGIYVVKAFIDDAVGSYKFIKE